MKPGRNSARGVVRGLSSRQSRTTMSGALRKIGKPKPVTLPTLETARKVTTSKAITKKRRRNKRDVYEPTLAECFE